MHLCVIQLRMYLDDGATEVGRSQEFGEILPLSGNQRNVQEIKNSANKRQKSV